MFSTVNALVTALPAAGGGGDAFTAVDNIGASLASSISGLGVAVGCLAAAGVLWASGMKFTILRCVLAGIVGAFAYLAVSDWQMFTDVIKQTLQNAFGGGK